MNERQQDQALAESLRAENLRRANANDCSAATGRECGGRKPEGADNRRQPVIGMHKDRGPSDGVTYTGRGTGNSSPCGCCGRWGVVKEPGGFSVVGCGQCPTSPTKDGLRQVYDAISDAVSAGEDPETLSRRIHTAFPGLLTHAQVSAGIAYLSEHMKLRRVQRDEDVVAVRELLGRLPAVLARMEAAP